MIIVGLDLSLVKTGYAILKDDGTVLVTGLIKSKPSGDSHSAEIKRIVKIAETAVEMIDNNLEEGEEVLILIENLAFMARNTSALVQLAGLNYLIRALLNELEWSFVMVSPSTLKKFITGKGNSDKSLMMMTVYKNYGFESFDDNVCDAYALAVCGLAILGKPLRNLSVPQQEAVTLLQKQL